MQPEVYEKFNEVEGVHWWFKGRRRFLKALLSRYLRKDKDLTLFEVGSGTGGNLPLLAEFGRVDACEMNDVARSMIETKNIKGVAKVYGGYLPDNLPTTGKYDAVLSLDVIEHVEDDLAGLKALKEHLSDDGTLILTVPAYNWLWSEHDVANHHHRRYTIQAFCNLVEQAGFTIKHASYFNTLLFPLAVIERVSSRLRKQAGEDAGLVVTPAKPLNRALLEIFSLESKWAGKMSMPFGLSIAVVAKHKE